MKFAVLGAGGIGGYYGGMLARAGHEVYVLARGENLAALRERGLEVRVPGDSFVARVHAGDDAGAFGAVECAIVAVKNYSLAEVAPAAARLANSGAAVLPLLNGVDVAERLAELGVPRAQILGGLTTISVARVAPGVFERRSPFQKIVAGELPGSPDTGRVGRIVEAFTGAGIDAEVSADIVADLWHKFCFIASAAAVCGLARSPIGPLRATAAGRRLIERAVREVVAVGRARGAALPDDEAERVLKFIESLPGELKPSLLLDVEAGRQSEIDDLSGAVSRFARAAGVETPIHDTTVAALSVARAAAGQRR